MTRPGWGCSPRSARACTGSTPRCRRYLAARWRREEPDDHDAVRDAATGPCCPPTLPSARWLRQQIESGDAGLAYAVIGLQRRTLGSLLGYALDHRSVG